MMKAALLSLLTLPFPSGLLFGRLRLSRFRRGLLRRSFGDGLFDEVVVLDDLQLGAEFLVVAEAYVVAELHRAVALLGRQNDDAARGQQILALPRNRHPVVVERDGRGAY